jgi:hypothetical protein
MSIPPPDVFTQITSEGFEALVSKGIHVLLFRVHRVGGVIQTDKSVNLLCGYPVGGFNTSGESVDSEDFQDQIRGGMHKTKVGGAIDPGDITFNAYFDPNRGKPEIEGVVNSMSITPQFVLALARKKSSTQLQGFFAAGVNYAGGMDIKGDYGKIIGSSLKFAITGEPKFGHDAVGTFPMSDYTAGATGLIASADPLQSLLNSTEPPEMTA